MSTELRAAYNIPPGKLVLLIDDDANFINSLAISLEEQLAGVKAKNLQILPPAFSLDEFEAQMTLLRAAHRQNDLIFAFVDLNLPKAPDDSNAAPANGKRILRTLREMNVQTVLVTSKSPGEVGPVEGDPVFVTKPELKGGNKLHELVLQIVTIAEGHEDVSLAECDVLSSPVVERGQTRRLPLAFKSPAMRALRNSRLPKAAVEAAAVLAIGEPGVEFEQLAWLFHREISKGGISYRFRAFDCETGGSPVPLLERPEEQGGPARRCFFLRNLHALEAGELATFCQWLAQCPAIGVGGDRLVLTVHNPADDSGRKRIERLLDLFCLAGYDDFFLLDVPPLSRERPEDIAVYTEYFLRRWSADKDRAKLDIDDRARSLIKNFEYRRNFKQLSVSLDRLFHARGGGVINSAFVRQMYPDGLVVETAAEEVVKLILKPEPVESGGEGSWSPGQLKETCSQFLLQQKSSEEDSDDLRGFTRELEQIVSALETARNLDTEKDGGSRHLLRTGGTRFWPWSRYPVCPRLLAQLERHQLTVGLVRVPQ